jgi:hypothetical protein
VSERAQQIGGIPISATQIIGGVEVPVAGTWSVDPGHTEVGFVGRHLGLTKTRGRIQLQLELELIRQSEPHG